MAASIYSNPLWAIVRNWALDRDGSRCTVSRWLGGTCTPGPLHVHHIHAVEEGGSAYDLDNLGTTCAAHHPMWEALRRRIVAALLEAEAAEPPPLCTHRHPTADARAICERRLARQHDAKRRQHPIAA